MTVGSARGSISRWRRRVATAAGLTLILWAAVARPAAAHGLDVKGEVPLPLWAVAVGGATALVLSFVILGTIWREPRFEHGAPAVLLPEPAGRAVAGLGWFGRVAGLAAFAVVWAAALFGPFSADENLAPYAIYVALWTGGLVVSGLVGDVWSAISPFETVGDAAARLNGDAGAEPAPVDAIGVWPAAGLLLGFGWLELVHPTPADPRTLGVAITVYVGILVIGAAWWGRPWLRSAEAFGALFRLVAAMAPLCRDERGRLRLRPPLAGLGNLDPPPGTAALVIVALGITTFDGVTRSALWETIIGNRADWAAVPHLSVGLVVTLGLVAAIYVGAMAYAARQVGRRTSELVDAFAHSLVPIAVGYAVAHYFSLLVFQGQRLIALASDPLGTGADLFGTVGWTIDYELVSPLVIGVVQAGAIVVGHLAAVVLAHDRAIAMFEPKLAVKSQHVLLDVMVVYTVAGLVLLLG